MIHFIMFCFFIYGLCKFFVLFASLDDEHNALGWVGPEKFKEAKQTMTDKEFKKFVKENSQKMKKAQNDAAEYYRKNRK